MERSFAVAEQKDLAAPVPGREFVERRLSLVDVVGQRQHVEHPEIRRRNARRHVDAGADLVEADRSDAASLQGERELRAASIRARQERRRPVAIGRPAPGEEHDAGRGAVARRQCDRRGQRVTGPDDRDVLDHRGVLHARARKRAWPRSDTSSMLRTLARRSGNATRACCRHGRADLVGVHTDDDIPRTWPYELGISETTVRQRLSGLCRRRHRVPERGPRRLASGLGQTEPMHLIPWGWTLRTSHAPSAGVPNAGRHQEPDGTTGGRPDTHLLAARCRDDRPSPRPRGASLVPGRRGPRHVSADLVGLQVDTVNGPTP